MPDLTELVDALGQSLADVVHFQFNYGFFELEHLAGVIRRVREDKGIVITLHRTSPADIDGQQVALGDIKEALSLVDALIVHQQADVENLAQVGIDANVVLIPHGSHVPVDLSPEEVRRGLGLDDRRIVSTFGFLLPHKGVIRLLEAFDVLRRENPDLLLLALTSLHPDPISKAYLKEVEREIEERHLENHVLLVTEYLSDQTARTVLRGADVIVLPYDPTPESASGAARFVLSAGRPVIATDLPIFSDAGQAILRVPHGDSAALAAAMRSVLDDPGRATALAVRAESRAAETRWDLVAAQHLDVYRRASRAAGQRARVRAEPGRLIAASA